MTLQTAPCFYCPEKLVFIQGRGFVHDEGGVYVQFCPSCGWKGAPFPIAQKCPRCGNEYIRDDHRATPNRSKDAVQSNAT